MSTLSPQHTVDLLQKLGAFLSTEMDSSQVHLQLGESMSRALAWSRSLGAAWTSQAQLSIPQASPQVDILNFTSLKHSTNLRCIQCHHCRRKRVLSVQLISLCRNTCTHHLFLPCWVLNYTNEVVIFISKESYLIGENAAHICVIPRLNDKMWECN